MMLLAKSVRAWSQRQPMRGESGFTLMEVLLSTLISTMIALPLLAWIIVAFRSQHRVERTAERTHVVTMVNQHFPRDVASSAGVALNGGMNPGPGQPGTTDCTDAGPGDLVAVSLMSFDRTRLVVYAAVPTGPQRSDLVRRTCALGGAADDVDVIAANVPVPAPSLLKARATHSAARPTEADVRIDLLVDLGEGSVIEASGTRRVGEDPA